MLSSSIEKSNGPLAQEQGATSQEQRFRNLIVSLHLRTLSEGRFCLDVY